MSEKEKTIEGEAELVEVIAIPFSITQKKKKELTSSLQLFNAYLGKGIVSDFTAVPFEDKLLFLQRTPSKFIKKRKIGKTMIPYVEHEYAEKALNFVFSFNMSAEIVSKEFIEYTEKYKDWYHKDCKKDEAGNKIPVMSDRDVIEAECEMKFTFRLPDGSEIKRHALGSHKGYKNPATTRGDIMKSAMSKSYTVVARTFGIGADLKKSEQAAYARVAKNDGKAYTAPVKKSFNGSSPGY